MDCYDSKVETPLSIPENVFCVRPLGNLSLTSRDSELQSVNRGFLFMPRLLPVAPEYFQGRLKTENEQPTKRPDTYRGHTTIAAQVALHMCVGLVCTHFSVHKWKPGVSLSCHFLGAVHPVLERVFHLVWNLIMRLTAHQIPGMLRSLFPTMH